MRRIVLLLIAAMVIAVLPAMAVAQVFDEEAALLREKADGLAGSDAAEWEASLVDFEAALADLKTAAPDLDYAALDAAIADLHTAIDGGDISEIEAAGAAVAAEAAAVADEAEAAGVEVPAGVGTGSEVPTSPNAALLAIAGILALLAGGALALRWSSARR